MGAASGSSGKVVINLTAGHEDADRVTVAFLVGTAALRAGHEVTMFLTKEAVRIAVPGYASAVESAGAPTVEALLGEYLDGGGTLLACPVCFDARRLAPDDVVVGARVAGATPLFEWIGAGATVFSY